MKKYTIIALLLAISAVLMASEPVKVMTYNIWNGFDWGKDTKREKKFVKYIKSEKPDVIALQELCGFTQDKLEKTAKKWGHNYAVIVKEKGYPVGITSRKPINVKEKKLKDLWHGMLHCETFGIDFFVVHLSPFDRAFRAKEAKIISQKVAEISNDKYIVLGDFNAHSPMDADILNKKTFLLEKSREFGKKHKNYDNLLANEFDYSVISTFLSHPLVDVCNKYMDTSKKFSYPTFVFKDKKMSAKEYSKKYERIDYILVSPDLSRKCKSATVINSGSPEYLSDHYPAKAEFVLE